MGSSLPDPLLSSLSTFVAARLGLSFPRQRWCDLERAVGSAAREFQFADTELCVRWLLSSALTKNQLERLASHLTIGETYFFREQASFAALEHHILRELLRSRGRTGRRLRIWSAGCSTGEEAYSIAIALNKTLPDCRDWNITILATDINPHFLRKASRGIYDAWSFRHGLPALQEESFRRREDGRFEIAPHIKALVTFASLNLADDSYPSAAGNTSAMDIVFCRNVLMYFEPDRAKAMIQKLCRALREGGWLLVSPVETPLVGLPELVPVRLANMMLFRKASRQDLLVSRHRRRMGHHDHQIDLSA